MPIVTLAAGYVDVRADVSVMDVPDFIIFGVAKCGTTSLYEMLHRKDDVFMPDNKEPHYFVSRRLTGKRVFDVVADRGRYLDLFRGRTTERMAGEASVLYFTYIDEAIENIRRERGDDIKIIVCLRNPVDRCLSSYAHMKMYTNLETRSFDEVCDGVPPVIDEPMLDHLTGGLYAAKLAKLFAAFRQVHIVIMERLVDDTLDEFNMACNFLGVGPVDQVIMTHSNPGKRVYKSDLLSRMINSRMGMVGRRLVKSIAPSVHTKVKSYITDIHACSIDAMTPEQSSKLVEYYRSDIAETGGIVSRDLSCWSRRWPRR